MNKPMTPYYVEPEDLSTTDRTRREDFTQRGIVHKPVYLAADVDVELTALRAELAQQLDDLPPHSVAYQQRITALELQLTELQEWKRIIIGTGTDQEAVIRLAATEYTKIAVACWQDKVIEVERLLDVERTEHMRLEQGLAAAYLEVRHYRAACASVGETDGHGWAETTRELRRQIAAMIVDRDEARIMYENQCAGSKSRHEHIQSLNQQLAVTKNVIAQLSEQLAESDRMKKALRSKLDDHNISDVSMGWV